MITLPNQPKIIDSKDNQATFEIEACYPGYGITLGNALRRVLLSSLPGAAVTGVKIKGVQHEFSTIDDVLEDVVQIILNLKQIRFKLNTKDPVTVSLKAKGEKEVKAKDIKTSAELEIINPDVHIATLTGKKAELDMEIEIEPGLGYSAVEQRKKEKLEVGKIAIDAIFTPVKKVNYSTENMRVGDRTDYDKLQITIETDGSITPKQAFLDANKILLDHFKILSSLEEKKKKSKKEVKEEKAKTEDKKKTETKKEAKPEEDITKAKVEELKLPSRVVTILESAKIKTVGGLIRKTEEDLQNIEGLGDKAIKEIKRALGRLGLSLK